MRDDSLNIEDRLHVEGSRMKRKQQENRNQIDHHVKEMASPKINERAFSEDRGEPVYDRLY